MYLLQDADDAALVGRSLAGDATAFETLVGRHQRVLFTVAYRMLGNREDAADALQSALIKAYEHLASFDPRHRFFSWIYRIVVNECLNMLRARRPEDALNPAVAAVGTPFESAAAAQRAAQVQLALMQLTTDARAVIVLRHFGDLSYDQIAETLGVPSKTVKSRLHSARQKLGEQLLGVEATLMTDRREELLQARVDGELTSDERHELDRLLEEDASTRLRAGELDALSKALNVLGPEDPPARVLRAVIDHVKHNAPEALPEYQTTATGGLMRTKVLWGLAAAAGIVLAVLAYTGFPPESGGSEGAIGAAKRYQAGQIAASDVKLGDQAAQEFLQSDLFDRLRKDEAVVAALSNPSIAKALANPALMKALTDNALRLRITDAAFSRALNDEAFARALLDPAFGRALNDIEFAKALTDPGFSKAVAEVGMGKAISSAELAKAFNDPALVKALKDPGLVKALTDVDFKKALTDADFKKALTDVDLMKALTDVDIAKALTAPALVKALNSADLQAALKSNGLSAALKSPQFGEAMRAAR